MADTIERASKRPRLEAASRNFQNCQAGGNARVQYGDTHYHYQKTQEDTINEFRRWLNAPDHTFDHYEAQKKHEPGTGRWFLESGAYNDWLYGDSRLLWLHGKAGCCKTILCSAIIEDVQQRLKDFQDSMIAFFYFSFRDERRQSYQGLLLSLLSQIVGSDSVDLNKLKAACSLNQKHPKALEKILTTLLEDGPRIKLYVLVDALDECPERTGERQRIMDGIKHLLGQCARIRALVTSRNETDIRHTLTQYPAIDVPIGLGAVNADIAQYVEREIERDYKLQSLVPGSKTEIKSVLAEKAGGMFRWAFCQLDRIRRLRVLRPQTITEVLRSLPRTLDETYERILIQITEDEVDLSKDVLTLLRWLAFEYLGVTLGALRDACVTTCADGPGGGPYVDKGSRQAVESLILSLPTLIEVRYYENDNVPWTDGDVSLAHFSVKEYLLSERIRGTSVEQFALREAESRLAIAQICVAHLLYYSQFSREHNNGQPLTISEQEEEWPLVGFAVFWYVHQKSYEMLESEGAPGDDLHLSLLANEMAAENFFYRLRSHAWGSESVEDFEHLLIFQRYASLPGLPLLFCVAASLKQTTAHLLGLEMDSEDMNLAFVAAAYAGHVEAVERLLMLGVNVNHVCMPMEDEVYEECWQLKLEAGTALEFASSKGHIETVRVLLAHGAHAARRSMGSPYTRWRNDLGICNGREVCGGSPLCLAAQEGYHEVVRELLNAMESAELKDREEIDLALRLVADNVGPRTFRNLDSIASDDMNSASTIGILLDAGANPRTSKLPGNILHASALYGQTDLIHILKTGGADPNDATEPGPSLLATLIMDGYKDVIDTVRILMDIGADVNAKGRKKRYPTALQAVFDRGPEKRAHGQELMQLLLDAGAKFSKFSSLTMVWQENHARFFVQKQIPNVYCFWVKVDGDFTALQSHGTFYCRCADRMELHPWTKECGYHQNGYRTRLFVKVTDEKGALMSRYQMRGYIFREEIHTRAWL